MTRRKRPPGPLAHADTDQPAAAMTIAGHHLRRYGNTWCAQTQAGTWRKVDWLGTLSVHAALDLIHDGHQPEPHLLAEVSA